MSNFSGHLSSRRSFACRVHNAAEALLLILGQGGCERAGKVSFRMPTASYLKYRISHQIGLRWDLSVITSRKDSPIRFVSQAEISSS